VCNKKLQNLAFNIYFNIYKFCSTEDKYVVNVQLNEWEINHSVSKLIAGSSNMNFFFFELAIGVLDATRGNNNDQLCWDPGSATVIEQGSISQGTRVNITRICC